MKKKKETELTAKDGDLQKTEFDKNLRRLVARSVGVLNQLQSCLVQKERGDVQVARLAIELAKLNRSVDPILFLPKAARLLTEARHAVSYELERPSREARQMSQQIIDEADSRAWVRWDQICKAGKRDGGTEERKPEAFEINDCGKRIQFTWRPMTEIGFRKMLAKYWEWKLGPEYKTVGEELVRILGKNQISAEDRSKALALIQNRLFWNDPEFCKGLEQVESSHQAEVFVQNWLERASTEVPKYFMENAKSGLLGQETLYALYKTRSEGMRGRSLKAAAARRKKKPPQKKS